MLSRNKSKYRIVPANYDNIGSCWALKEGDLIIGTFISKQLAEKRKMQLETKVNEEFLFN